MSKETWIQHCGSFEKNSILEVEAIKDKQAKDIANEVEKCNLGKVIPFGAQYLESPKVNCPGPVEMWSWEPAYDLKLGYEASSWPGTTGTGPTTREDERYGENQ